MMQCVVSWACMWGNMQNIDIYKDSNNLCLENIAVVASCIVLGRDELIVSSWLMMSTICVSDTDKVSSCCSGQMTAGGVSDTISQACAQVSNKWDGDSGWVAMAMAPCMRHCLILYI